MRFAIPVLSLTVSLLLRRAPLVTAVPVASPDNAASGTNTNAASSSWLASIKRQGNIPFGDANYKIFRNVKDYGAKGDGATDDTDAINKAVSDGARCSKGCDSSTVTPALVYFPPGTYAVKKPIVQLYYTQFVGDALNPPTLKATPDFSGTAVVDADPYDGGVNFYINQNNFYRQVRNFVIDITEVPPTSGACIHWQVAQATSLQNIVFKMAAASPNNSQKGIYMDNGSGGFMTDLSFYGGGYGMFLGNQQFTTRNLTFDGVNTAIYVNWNWLWNFKSLNINKCQIGIDMSALNGSDNNSQKVGSVIVQDSKISAGKGIVTAWEEAGNVPATGGTLVVDNSDFTGSDVAVYSNKTQETVLKGGSVIASWTQGNGYTTGADASTNTTNACSASAKMQKNFQGTLAAVPKPTSLVSGGKIYERSRPQYENYPASAFISVKTVGAKGDGVQDDTEAIQNAFNSAKENQVVYFDHGAYVVTKTVKVPKNIKITGEMWPLIMASGNAFSSQESPLPVFQVGEADDVGSVEMSDLVFETKGNAPGAILIEWNLGFSSQGSSGMWDVHTRIGGTAGTKLQSDTCAKNPNATHPANSACFGVFLSLHITQKGSVYLENNHFWTSDHELELKDHGQIDIYTGRGVLVESEGPNWFYGTASEHAQLYNYQIVNSKDIYLGIIQTETPYMQPNPDALGGGFKPNPKYSDPDFSTCTTSACKMAWGLRVLSSSNVLVYGAGLYSFFSNYDQTCLATESCQDNMVSIECSEDIYLWGLSTKASTNMVTIDGVGVVPQKDNRNGFCSTIAFFEEVGT